MKPEIASGATIASGALATCRVARRDESSQPNQSAPCDALSPPSSRPPQIWHFRAATSADVPAIVAIDCASFTQPWSPRSFEKAVTDDKTIVLVAQTDAAGVQAADGKAASGDAVGSKVIGYGVAYTVGDEGEVMTLAIAATARGCGLGHALLQTLLQQCAARGARQMFLEVRVGNTNAQRLYERCGFAPVGLRRRYYADGEDAIVMKKVLAAD